jgi:hypothetical protein
VGLLNGDAMMASAKSLAAVTAQGVISISLQIISGPTAQE